MPEIQIDMQGYAPHFNRMLRSDNLPHASRKTNPFLIFDYIWVVK
jgi:hypothetical protein